MILHCPAHIGWQFIDEAVKLIILTRLAMSLQKSFAIGLLIILLVGQVLREPYSHHKIRNPAGIYAWNSYKGSNNPYKYGWVQSKAPDVENACGFEAALP